MITLTGTAHKRMKKFLSENDTEIGIRLSVRSFGCSGLAYTVGFADQVFKDDIIVEVDGINIIVNEKDQPYCRGLTIDYVTQGLTSAFTFSNPNERGKCGCGKSFTV
jgi:iron-sulfur cluster assembly protein